MHIFRPVTQKIWTDQGFLMYKNITQAVYLHLCSNPHTTPFGLYPASAEGLAAHLRRDIRAYKRAMFLLEKDGYVSYDKTAQVVYLLDSCEIRRPPNPNVLKNWGKIFNRDIPSSKLKEEYYFDAKAMTKDMGKAFEEAFSKAFTKAFTKGYGNTGNREQ